MYLYSKCVRYYLSWLSILWFCRQNCVYYTDLGQKIGKEKDVVYVSTTQGRTWTELAQFALGNTSEAYLFLEHQLELFRYLCHVRTNEFIHNLNYSWEGGGLKILSICWWPYSKTRMQTNSLFIDIYPNKPFKICLLVKVCPHELK